MTEEQQRDELLTPQPTNARERLRKTRDMDSAERGGPQLGDGLAGGLTPLLRLICVLAWAFYYDPQRDCCKGLNCLQSLRCLPEWRNLGIICIKSCNLHHPLEIVKKGLQM